jgi:hypothetical protein
MSKMPLHPMAVQAWAIVLATVCMTAGCAGSEAEVLRSPRIAANAPSRPNMGVNLEKLADWGRSGAFVDLMKTSRAWGSATAPWLATDEVDAQGWPLGDAGVVVATHAPDIADPSPVYQYVVAGSYRLTFDGQAHIRTIASPGVSVSNLVFDPATQRSSAVVNVAEGTKQLMLSFTGTSGGIRQVRLIRPGYTDDQVFTREFLAAIAPFGTLRVMDWLATNGNPSSLWQERTLPTSATQGSSKGAALEHIIRLANQTRKDIWINVPLKADDEYVRSLAALLKSTLDPGLTVYVEFSNELWNRSFSQTALNQGAAVEEAIAGDTSLTRGIRCAPSDFGGAGVTCNPVWAGHFRAGKRIARISRIFSEVYGAAELGARFRPVYASQFGNRHIAEQVLKAMEKYWGSPRSLLYGIAVAPYFYLDRSLVRSTTLTTHQILDSLDSSLSKDVLPLFRRGTQVSSTFLADAPYLGRDWSAPSQKTLADHYGLVSIAYEGGPDFWPSPESLPAKFDATTDARMGELLQRFFAQWYGCGNGLFMYYDLTSTYGRSGYFGLTNNVANLNTVKYRAVQAVAGADAKSFSKCR